MSQEWSSRVLTVVLVVLLVTSTIAPVAAAGTPSAPPASAGSNTNQFDFSGIGAVDSSEGGGDTDSPEPSADVSTSTDIQPSTSLPTYAEPDLERIQISLGTPSTNSNGKLKIPVQVNGQYKDGQYPWRIPVSVTIESGDLKQSMVVWLAPGRGPSDYWATGMFTLQFVQDGTTAHPIRVTATSQVGDRDSDVDQKTIDVKGVSDESSITTSGQIRNNDVSEPPNEVSHVTRYRATERADGYLEDASLPVGGGSLVENFTHARDANNKYAILQSFRGEMDIGTLTTNTPNGSAQTLVIRYNALGGDDVYVTPVTSSGFKLDNRYRLPANPADDARCHDGATADICIFRLSDLESNHIGEKNELILKYHARTDTSLALFCQDLVTGGMPDNGGVCGLGSVNSYSSGNIVGIRAVDTATGNSAPEESTLNVNPGTDVRIDVIVENKGNTPMSGSVSVATTDPTNFSARSKSISLAGGERRVVSFSGYSMDSRVVKFTSTFEDSSEWVEVAPTGLRDDAPPVASAGGPYIVPLEVIGETKSKLGLQTQTLTERPSPDWTKVRDIGPSDGTDEWTTYAYRVPVIGTIGGLEASSDNITYINDQLSATQGAGVTIQDAYAEYISDAERQLPGSPADWTLHDVKFTAHVTTERKIDDDRPTGYGWRKIDKYGQTATGEFETAQFRSLANGSESTLGGTVIDTDGSGWVKQDNSYETKLTGYEYNNSSDDPDFYEPDNMTDGKDDWERYQYVGTRYVVADRINWDHKYQDEQYDPGGNWTFVGQMDNGTYHYVRPTYKEVDVWTWRKPVYHVYYTYKRPLYEATYEWERNIYDAKLIFQKPAATSTLSEWRGPLYTWTQQYETESVTLSGDHSYDVGPPSLSAISAYKWEFDDGTTTPQGLNQNVTTREYSTPFGVYMPAVTVWDNYGNSAKNNTSVHVIPEPIDCQDPCEPTSAIPALDATDKRDPVDWQMEEVAYTVDITGKTLNEKEWTVKITAPKANASFEQEIWRGYDIVDGKETVHGLINPRTNDLGPGEVEFVVTATPTGQSEPRVVDTFTVYLCHQDRDGFHPASKGCDDLDPDSDGLVNSNDGDPYCTQANNDECYCARHPGEEECSGEFGTTTDGLVEHSAEWDTVADWRTAISRHHLTFIGSGRESGPMMSTEGVLRLGYERNVTAQENKYPALIGFYDMEKGDIYYTNDWNLSDDSPTPIHSARIWADSEPNMNGGEFENGNNGNPEGEYAYRAPRFGAEGVFGSRGAHYDTDTFGYISFISPTDTAPDGDPRVGQKMSDEFWNDKTISFWARTTQGRDREGKYTEHFWAMQNENNNQVDQAISDVVLRWGECDSNIAGTKCSYDEVHAFQRWNDDASGYTDGYDTWDEANERVKTEGCCTHYYSGDNLNAMEAVKSGDWHHYAWVVDGGNNAGDEEALYLYIDGDLYYARTFSEVYGSDTAENAYWTVNQVSSEKKLTRFIWGGSWHDDSGLVRLMHGMKFDNIRVHNEALTQSQIRNGEYIDDGYMETTPKWLNETTHESYNTTAPDVNVTYHGYMPAEGAVNVQVIPWELVSGSYQPNYSASATTSFTSWESKTITKEQSVNLGVDNVSRVSINVTANSTSKRYSPKIDFIEVTAYENGTVSINNTDPVAKLFTNASDYTETQSGRVYHVNSGDDVNFVGKFSSDSTGNITQYQYSVEGPDAAGTTSTSGSVSSGDEIPDFTHEFKCGGTHTVDLTVQDEYGAVNTTTLTFDVANQAPIAEAEPNEQYIGPGGTATFDGTNSSDSDGTITEYDWFFHDTGVHDYNPTTSRTYSSPGNYTVTLTVTDDGCDTDSENVTVYVRNDAPTSDAGPNQTVATGETVQFDGTGSTDPNGDTLSYEWDIDADGTYELTGATPTHTYQSEGNRTVTLRVSDPYGASDTDTMTVSVGTNTSTSSESATVTIDNPTSQSLSHYQVKVTVQHQSGMNTDFSDIRFYQGGTQLDYWVESYSSGSSATVWVKVGSIAASGDSMTLDWSSTSTTSQSDPRATMVKYDLWGDGSVEGTLSGAARLMNAGTTSEFVELTDTVDSQEGVLDYGSTPTPGFHAEFQYYIGDGNGADSVSLHAWNNGNYRHHENPYGNGYTWLMNDHDDCIGVAYNSECGFDTANVNPETSSWQSATAWGYNNSGTLDYYLNTRGYTVSGSKSSADFDSNLFGFGGRTGGLNNHHWVRRVVIRKYVGQNLTTTVNY